MKGNHSRTEERLPEILASQIYELHIELQRILDQLKHIDRESLKQLTVIEEAIIEKSVDLARMVLDSKTRLASQTHMSNR